MADITIENITELFREELSPIRAELQAIQTRLANIESAQEVHTRALDQLLKERKSRE